MGSKVSYLTNWLLYYVVVFPISLLPLRLIYLITDLLFLFMIYVFPYREKLIRKNIHHTFTDISKRERIKIKRAFYRHFTDLLAESVKNISISKYELKRRIKVSNPEIMNKLYREGKDVLLVSGHYNNWEWMITSQNLLLKHEAIGVGMPLSNPFWNKKLNERRARFGMKIISANEVHSTFSEPFSKPTATLLLSDQSPVDGNKAYWMTFLNQPSAVLFGCEQLAHQYNKAVVFFIINKRRRGRYKIDFELICDDASTMNWGEITEKHTHLLEQKIKAKPEFWIWSHNRWKRDIPENLEELKSLQKEKFNIKFKKELSTTD